MHGLLQDMSNLVGRAIAAAADDADDDVDADDERVMMNDD